jgi:catechol 2,3-dioxygenase-like lactoylglutathione lyase family enzyme
MSRVKLEHLNVSVRDAENTSEWMIRVFDWRIRWSGPGGNGGVTYHVGEDETYVALHTPPKTTNMSPYTKDYSQVGGLNHVAVLCDDIGEMEKRVLDAGFEPLNHADYEPGKRFYFYDNDGIEYEVVSYSNSNLD